MSNVTDDSGDAVFACDLLGWKQGKNKLVPNSADTDNAASVAVAAEILNILGVAANVPMIAEAKSGRPLERAVAKSLAVDIPQLDPSRAWLIDETQRSITDFVQYNHLRRIDELVKVNAELRTMLGTDYLIKPDVVVGLPPRRAGEPPFLHAAISCKWTIRSDRVQNIRHENNQMIRHRRERLPHLVSVTAEPLPSRLTSIARGTGEVDAVYHIAFDALDEAIRCLARKEVISRDQVRAWSEVVDQGRVRPYSDLARTLALW